MIEFRVYDIKYQMPELQALHANPYNNVYRHGFQAPHLTVNGELETKSISSLDVNSLQGLLIKKSEWASLKKLLPHFKEFFEEKYPEKVIENPEMFETLFAYFSSEWGAE